MLAEGKNYLKFKNVKNTVFAPFSGYYYMESMLISINDKDKKPNHINNIKLRILVLH